MSDLYTVSQVIGLLEDLHNDMANLHEVLTRIAERLDDEADRREEIFRLPDPEVPS